MKISKTKFYTVLFALILFFQLYLSSFKINIFIQIFSLVIYFYLEKVTISKKFFSFILPVIVLFFIGFIGAIVHKFPLVNIIKDIFHFLKPILGLVIGYLFYKKINDFRTFVLTIVISGFISSIIHFLVLVFTGGFSTGSINQIREFSKDNFLELFALFFLLFYKKFTNKNLFAFKNNYIIILISLLTSNILYFSRTMIVVSVILLLSVYGLTYITKKSIKYIGLAIIGIFIFYSYLFSVKIDRNKPGLEAFLYKVKIAPSELFKTKIDRNNHKELWDHWRGYESKRAFALMEDNPSSFIFGTGYGSLVNLKFKAPLTENKEGMKFISELHNGFSYILYKTGFIGLFILLYFLIKIYLLLYKYNRENSFTLHFISAIGIIYLFSSLTITGIYNGRDVIIFILGALFLFHTKQNALINANTNE